MQLYSERSFKWLGNTVECPDDNLLNKNYTFYARCKLDNIKYEAGQGVIVKVRLDSTPNIGMIHYFYETYDKGKCIVAVELFYKSKEIKTYLAKPFQLNEDLEIIKKDNLSLVHLSVFHIKSRCAIVYGLEDEEPQDVLQEFITSITDTLYICRFVATLKKGLFHLEAVVANEEDKNISDNSVIEILSDKNFSPTKNYGKYSVSQVEMLNDVKITLKRELSSPEKTDPTRSRKHVPIILAKKQQHSPSELIRNLTLSPKKRELPSKEQVEKMNKHFNKRKSTLSNLNINSEDDLEIELRSPENNPLIVLNKIDMKIATTNERSVRSCRKNAVNTPTRSSKRQSAKVSFTEFYSDDLARLAKQKYLDEEIVSSPRTRRNIQNTPRRKITFNETATPRKQKTEETPRKQKIVKETPTKQNKNLEETPKKKTNEEHSFETPKKLKIQTPRSGRLNIMTCTPKKKTNEEHSFETPKKLKIQTPRSGRLNIMTCTPKKKTNEEHSFETPKKLKIQTPRSGRLNIMTCTPSVEERDQPIVFCNTPMSRARMGLSAYSIPSKMPCRENEYLNIYNFVTGRLRDQSSGCMYISGVPGTGKTMTVCRVMSDLQKDDYDFKFLKLNALALTEPRQVYVEIVKMLLNKKLHWEEALKEIEKFFKAKKKKVAHVLLVDELDKLCNRKQDVVYNLLDLPFHSTTPLIVITIANTMDLPERILTNKVNSRLGLVRLTFKPYQYKDLVKIVTERLASDAVFKNEALELVARKVAAVSGDARRALAMCSRATEVAEEENKDLVSMDIVDRVIKEMSSSSKVQAIQCCSKLEQYILTSIANEVTRTGNEEVPFLNMIHNLEKLCLFDRFKLPSPEICLRSCHNLGSFRLLITQHGRVDINMTLMLNISTDDVHYALRR